MTLLHALLAASALPLYADASRAALLGMLPLPVSGGAPRAEPGTPGAPLAHSPWLMQGAALFIAPPSLRAV